MQEREQDTVDAAIYLRMSKGPYSSKYLLNVRSNLGAADQMHLLLQMKREVILRDITRCSQIFQCLVEMVSVNSRRGDVAQAHTCFCGLGASVSI